MADLRELDAVEFLRKEDLNTRDFFSTTRDTLKGNQFGGVIEPPLPHEIAGRRSVTNF